MKHIKILSLSLLLLTSLIGAMEEDSNNHLNRFFPENSLLRKRCNEEKKRYFQFGPLKTKKCRNCDYINNWLKRHDEEQRVLRGEDPLSVGVQLVSMCYQDSKMRSAIRAILPDQPDDVKFKEYDHISSAGSAVETQYEEREKKRKAQEAEQKKHEEEHPKF